MGSDHVTTPPNVAEFLLVDRNVPRSIHYSVAQAQKCLHTLTGSPVGRYRNDAERLIGRLCSDLDYIPRDDIMARGLHDYWDGLQQSLNEAGLAIQKLFFEV